MYGGIQTPLSLTTPIASKVGTSYLKLNSYTMPPCSPVHLYGSWGVSAYDMGMGGIYLSHIECLDASTMIICKKH